MAWNSSWSSTCGSENFWEPSFNQRALTKQGRFWGKETGSKHISFGKNLKKSNKYSQLDFQLMYTLETDYSHEEREQGIWCFKAFEPTCL